MINIKLARNSNIPSIRIKEGILHYAVFLENKYEALLDKFHSLMQRYTQLSSLRYGKFNKVTTINEKLYKKLLKSQFRIAKAKSQHLNVFLTGVAFASECRKEGKLIIVDLDIAEQRIKQTIENE